MNEIICADCLEVLKSKPAKVKPKPRKKGKRKAKHD